mmetsp:Transcript_7111/g.19045  ORF Transcript_7111/g.19045 Transcript_7111/m.19045 type:complete len:209 (-) Transcript_7111:529-1155(-)|eukprot:CAMPEP_0185843452 /NCGR_PEP_ID=MMETSP1353-20130828/18917_1 /TAXON_ID=1077150 /ORGANISM="Erythrolobus australicus, Strain CCMP3124" /LENGTH=208 /DNA_ID=CAMNT_0028542963 /DNA_START=105 /DNA_END=731 /DNA_ORIENTATION=+
MSGTNNLERVSIRNLLCSDSQRAEPWTVPALTQDEVGGAGTSTSASRRSRDAAWGAATRTTEEDTQSGDSRQRILRADELQGASAGQRKGMRRRRQLFTVEEDRVLLERIRQHGAVKWNEHARFFPGRTPGQLRARWAHVLRFESPQRAFTPQEDACILRMYEQHGSSWALIARSLRDRSDNAVKNRFHRLRRSISGSTPRDESQHGS